jgi:hypothetical protein
MSTTGSLADDTRGLGRSREPSRKLFGRRSARLTYRGVVRQPIIIDRREKGYPCMSMCL